MAGSWTKESTSPSKRLPSLSGAKIHTFTATLLLFALLAWFTPAHAAEVTALRAMPVNLEDSANGHASRPSGRIPRAAVQYRAELVRSARVVWGLDAPIAVFAAQVHTESWWRNDTVSHAGAQGLAQFMPSTAAWLPKVAPETGKPAPFNPGWSLRALCTYDKWLWDRTDGATAFERMAFTLSAYNGGQGWVNRDKRMARQRGLDPARWFDNVEQVNAGRSAAAWKENRQYPRRILKERQSAYVKAGWGPGIEEG